ncbi:MAG: dihydroorotate dehydrogenase electron transfer subunit [Deltaproteobacteria bacterium]|nr:dihydroorotate dehydrogenase electron transfer subunit [Deltaproteobacteria bacterium]MBW2361079.1 dihydroorotate dehydrogenase electron transfer subunit [Deltaproteobacteria bacterium]
MPAADPSAIRILAEVVANCCEGGAHHRLTLRVPGWPGFAPGQFVMLSPGPVGAVPRSDPLLPRPMAVFREHADERGPCLEVLYKRSGRGTHLLAAAVAGESIALVGPLGSGFRAPSAPGAALLVAGGTGIASVFELARTLADERAVSVLLGARRAEDLMGEADFAELHVNLEIATEDGSRGTRGLVTDLLEKRLAAEPGATVYACGPTPMMQRCVEIAAAHGAACSVSLENNMACGFGVCLGCAAPRTSGGFALVCCDGPVFDGRDIVWSQLP